MVAHLPIFGVGALDVLAFLQVCLQVHGEQRWAAWVVRATHRTIVTADLMFSTESQNINKAGILRMNSPSHAHCS